VVPSIFCNCWDDEFLLLLMLLLLCYVGLMVHIDPVRLLHLLILIGKEKMKMMKMKMSIWIGNDGFQIVGNGYESMKKSRMCGSKRNGISGSGNGNGRDCGMSYGLESGSGNGTWIVSLPWCICL
jgi:hypothetical protein